MSPADAGRALMIAGTDTGVGKTMIGALLLAELRCRGVRALACKPAETGCDPDPLDALTLGALAAEPIGLDDLCPYRFAPPVAPQSAAEAAGVRIEPGVVRAALSRLRARAELVLVESAGGLGSPYGPDLLVLDLARELALPVLLVAADALGTVGQTLLALRALEQQAVPCLGVVLCQASPVRPGPAAATHAPLIRQHGRGAPVLGRLPHLAEPMPSDARDAQALRAWASRQLPALRAGVDLAPILGAAVE